MRKPIVLVSYNKYFIKEMQKVLLEAWTEFLTQPQGVRARFLEEDCGLVAKLLKRGGDTK